MHKHENCQKFLEKYLELEVSPGFLNYHPTLPFSKNNQALQNRWDSIIASSKRNLMDLLHEETTRLFRLARTETHSLRREVRQLITDQKELEELKSALHACVERAQTQDKNERLRRLQRDIDAQKPKSQGRVNDQPVNTKQKRKPRDFQQRGRTNDQPGPSRTGQNANRPRSLRKGDLLTELLRVVTNMQDQDQPRSKRRRQ